jgi:acyl carrier protein
MPDSPNQIEQHVVRIMKRVSADPIEPTPDSELVADLGFDSLRLLELVAGLEDHFNIYIPLNEVPTIKTVRQTTEHVVALMRQQGRA